MDSSLPPKGEIWFLRVSHYISNPFYLGSVECCKNCTLYSKDRDSLLLRGFGNFLQDCTVSNLRRIRREIPPPSPHLRDGLTETHKNTAEQFVLLHTRKYSFGAASFRKMLRINFINTLKFHQSK